MVDHDPGGRQHINLKWWFWGTIFIMAGATAGLSLLAWQRVKPEPTTGSKSAPVAEPAGNVEAKQPDTAELHATLSKTASEVLTKVSLELDQELSQAYQPVYAAVSTYADLHYSLLGQYSELAIAASGKLEEMLLKHLFADHDVRMDTLHASLQQSIIDKFKGEIDAATKSLDLSGSLSQALKTTLEDMRSRISVSVPVSAAATLSAGLAGKATAKALATKIAAKSAGLAAAKAGGKWAAAGTSAGVSAAACSWSGPGAALCAVAGGVGVWVLADMSVLKLDEIWGRDEFEKDLRLLIDEQRAEHKRILQTMLIGTAIQQKQVVTEELKKFSPADLSRIEHNSVCTPSVEMREAYDRVRENLANRNLESVADLLRLSALHADEKKLVLLANEIKASLSGAGVAELSVLRISGTLPDTSGAERDISGVLRIGDQEIPFDRVPATENGSFRVELPQTIEFDLHKGTEVSLDLEQHRWLRNRLFTGSDIIPIASGSSDNGLSMDLRLPILIQQTAPKPADSRQLFAPGEVEITGRLRGQQMTGLVTPPECR